ncbi:MAG: hypothetical protein Q7S22_02050 [Candidatus Micrarchaeota archaeon]|nr:hypothetical protein [Candidatus Micrarchaeota archaeon]
MVFQYLLALVSGILVKAVDFIEDSKPKTLDSRLVLLSWPLAIAYGVTIGYLISQTPFSMILLAALFAQLVIGKIDNTAHGLGFTLAIVSTAYFGVPQFELFPFSIFMIFAILDETEFFKGTLDFMHHNRLFLPLSALIFAVAGKPDYLLGIVPFDVGYVLSDKGMGKFKQSPRQK